MKLPDTPKTIISQLSDPEEMAIWNGAWRRFFDIYHAPIKIMVGNGFYRRGWYGVPAAVIDEVVADTIVSLNEIFAKKIYDSSKSRFRCFLKTICERRVVDFLRRNAKDANFGSIDDDDSDALCSAEKLHAESQKVELEAEEKKAFKESLILDAYMSIRHKFDARTCAAFEMIKLEDTDVETVVRELGVSQNTVNNAVYRIMKKLKETVQKEREANRI